jgi:hypothetical protein
VESTYNEETTQATEETTKETTESTQETKETTETTQNDENTESIITEFKNHFGYELDGEFTEDLNGLKLLTTEVAKKIAQQELDTVFQAVPDVAEYMNYRLKGGDPERFFKVNFEEPDYEKFEITEDSTELNKQILRVFLKKQGFEDSEVMETIQDYEDTGILYKQANKAKPKLVNMQKTDKERLITEQQEAERKAIEEADKQWKQIETTINSGRLGNIAVPESEKKKFFDWLAIPIENGKSQRMIERESLDTESMLALEYLLYKKLDISKLAVAKQQTAQADKLKELLKNKGNESKGTAGSKVQKQNIISITDYI